MSYVQLYPLEAQIPKIAHHEHLPPSAVELGRCLDTTEAEELYVLVRREHHLSVLVAYTINRTTGSSYYCDQFDFPLAVLSWFPNALERFRLSPVEGGLHAGAMTSGDENVDGEMLCVQNATQGYYLVNRSRQSPLARGGRYMPTELSLRYEFLFRQGLLELWRGLGEQYENGTI